MRFIPPRRVCGETICFFLFPPFFPRFFRDDAVGRRQRLLPPVPFLSRFSFTVLSGVPPALLLLAPAALDPFLVPPSGLPFTLVSSDDECPLSLFITTRPSRIPLIASLLILFHTKKTSPSFASLENDFSYRPFFAMFVLV